MMKLRGGSLEVPATARAKQHVATEQGVRCDESDVIVEMAGYLDDVESDCGFGQHELGSLAQVIGDVRIVRMSPPVHRHVVYFTQFCDAADVVVVAMGAQDRIQLQSPRIKKVQHRSSFTRIDHGGVAIVVYGPDVVVLQGGDGGDFDC